MASLIDRAKFYRIFKDAISLKGLVQCNGHILYRTHTHTHTKQTIKQTNKVTRRPWADHSEVWNNS